MSKYYAVKVGKKTGIFNDWPTCQAQVSGFSGAIFKSFKTLNEAQAFLGIPTLSQDIQSAECSAVAYTDGSCIDRKGGWAYVLLKDNNIYQKYGPVPYIDCTNNIAELYAIWKCLSETQGDLLIRSDSEYSINCVTQWIYTWLNNGWKTAKGHPVENKDLIESIYNLMQGRNIKFEHVYGHTGNQYNELADQLANKGRGQL